MSLNMFGKTDPKDKEKEAMRREAYRRIERETYGLNISQLREWSKNRMKEELTTEMAKQQIAVSKVRDFLDAIATVVRLQSWWRMMKMRKMFFQIIEERRERKKLYFRALKIYWQSEKFRYYHLFGKFFLAWKEESCDQKRLRKLIQTFFSNCIHRMRLSPQAVMAYFSPGEWSCNISESDNMKIRRLIIQRLFNGWRLESRELKTVRYKASQILSRMMRRTKGPMWVKESTLVSFHMWYRYVKVKRAYRNGEPDPRFSNPFLPQWTKLYKDITVLRIRRKRSLETSHKLTQLRAFRNWKYLMTVDRTKPVTPLAVAINHYNSVICTKIMYAWFDLIRERGQNTRFRNKMFEMWKQWAPRNRYLREKNRDALEWLRLYRQRKAMDVMITICRHVVGARTEKIKEMRRNFCDRKLVIAAYGLMNKDEHVLMVDCWRRYSYFWRCHRNWKALNAQFSYQWYIHKAKAIFGAWKGYAKKQKVARMSKRVGELVNEKQLRQQGQQEEDEMDTILSPSKAMLGDPNAAELVALMQQLSETEANLNNENKENKAIYDNFLPVSDGLFQAARKGQLSSKLNPDQFFLFCFLYAQVYRRLPNHAAFVMNGQTVHSVHHHHNHLHHQDSHHIGPDSSDEGYRPRSASAPNTANPDAAKDATFNQLPRALQSHQQRIVPTALDATEHAAQQLVVNMVWRPEIQSELQHAVDKVNLQETTSLLAQGAVYDPRLVSQVGQHVGDQYVSLFVVLMMGCVSFLAERVIRKDRQDIVNNISHPMSALFAASQIKRWEQGKLTSRERSTLTQDLLVHDSIGGKFRSIYIWRNAVLLYLDIKAEDYARACKSLDEHRTVEEEVAEVMRRNKVERLISLRHKITVFLGHEAPWTIEDRVRVVLPPLVIPTRRVSSFFTAESLSPVSKKRYSIADDSKDIYTVLREYIFLTGRLAEEARMFRQPLMIRDKDLLVHGFLKQARNDLQALRRERMSVKDKEAEQEKKDKDAEKLRNKQDKEYAKIKKARKKRKAKLKKWRKKMSKKNKRNGDVNMGDMDEPDSAESETASMSSTFSSYDEHDLAGSDKFVMADLIDGMMSGMLEESEITMEKEFTQRVATACHPFPVFAETWIPYFWKDDPQTAQTYDNRVYVELKACVRRLLRIVATDERYALLRGPQQQQQQSSKLTIAAIPAESGKDTDQVNDSLVHHLHHHPFHLKDEYNGIGMYLIDQTLLYYNQGISPVWNLLPRDYWKFKLVRDRITRECTRMNAVAAGLESQYRHQKTKNMDTDDSVERYQKFLKKTRKEIVEIAEKQQGMYTEDEGVKSMKLKTLKIAEGKLAALKAQIKSQKEKFRFVDMLFTQNNFEAIEDMLKPKEDPNAEAEKSGKKTAKKEEVSRPSAETSLKYINDLEGRIKQLEGTIPLAESKIAQAKQDLNEFESVRRRMGRLLKSLAEERFNFMVDVQELMIRTSSQLDKGEDEQDRLRKYRKFQLAYTKQLQYFFDDKVTDRGLQLTKEAEQRKYQELMSRPGSKLSPSERSMRDLHEQDSSSGLAVQAMGLATPTISASRVQTPYTAHGGGGGGGGGSSFFGGPTSSVGGTRKGGLILGELDSFNEMADNSPAGITSPPFSPGVGAPHASASFFGHLRSSATMGSGSGGAGIVSSPSSRNLMPSFNVGQEGGRPGTSGSDQEQLSSHQFDFYGDGHSFGLDPEEHLAEMAAAFGHSIAEDDDLNDDFGPMRNTRRSVDEQIALMHYNSPEKVKQREEELRLLADEKARQAEIQELRMRTFDEYWTAYPRRELEFEGEVVTSASIDTQELAEGKGRRLNSRGIEIGNEDDLGSLASSLSTRATRMWKSIGQAYWRAKEDAVRNMIQERMDATGLNPEELEEINFGIKDGIDPLDAELDFLHSQEAEATTNLSNLLTPSKLALADQFQHLPDDLWWKYSLVPTMNQVLYPTAVGAAAIAAGAASIGVLTPNPSSHMPSHLRPLHIAVDPHTAYTGLDGDSPSLASTTSQQRRSDQIKLSVSLKDVPKEGEASSKGPGSDSKKSVSSPAFMNRRKPSTIGAPAQDAGSTVSSNPDDAPDPFILMGKATFKFQKESLAHRARMALEMDDDEFSVDSRMNQLAQNEGSEMLLMAGDGNTQGGKDIRTSSSNIPPSIREAESIHFSVSSSATSSVTTQKSRAVSVAKYVMPHTSGSVDQHLLDVKTAVDEMKVPLHHGPLFNDDDDTINSEEQEAEATAGEGKNDDMGSRNSKDPSVISKPGQSSRIDDSGDHGEQESKSLQHQEHPAETVSKVDDANVDAAGDEKPVRDTESLAASVGNESQSQSSTKSKASFLAPKLKRAAKSLRQSFAATTGTEVLAATQRFLNDPEIQGKLSKLRQPSVMKPTTGNNGIHAAAAAAVTTHGGDASIADHDAETGSVGQASAADAIHAALRRVRADFVDDGFHDQKVSFGDDDDTAAIKEEEDHEGGTHRRHRANDADGLQFSGSFSFSENTMAMVAKQQRNEESRRSMNMHKGSFIEDEVDEEHHSHPQAVHFNFDGSHLDMDSSHESQLFHLSFNDSTSQLSTPVNGVTPGSNAQKKKVVTGSTVRRSIEPLRELQVNPDDVNTILSAKGLHVTVPSRPGSPHHRMDVAVAEAMSRTADAATRKIGIAMDPEVPLQDPVLSKPLVEQLDLMLHDGPNGAMDASTKEPRSTASVVTNSLMEMAMAGEDLGFRPSTTDIQELITALKAGFAETEDKRDQPSHSRFQYFPPEFRQNDPDFQALERNDREEKIKKQNAEKAKAKAAKIKQLGKPQKHPSIGVVAIPEEAESLKQEETAKQDTPEKDGHVDKDEEEDNPDDAPKKRLKLVAKTDPGYTLHVDPSAVVYPDAKDDSNDAVFRSAAARRLLSPTLINARPPSKDNLSQINTSPARKPTVDPQYRSRKVKAQEKEEESKTAVEEVLLAGIVKPYERKQVLKKKKLGKSKSAVHSEGSTGAQEEEDIDLMHSHLDHHMRKSIQSGQLTSMHTVDTVTNELRKLIQSQEEFQSSAPTAPPLSLIDMRTKLQTRDMHFQNITDSKEQVTNFYQLPIPRPSSPDYQRTFVHPKSSDQPKRRPTTEELRGVSPLRTAATTSSQPLGATPAAPASIGDLVDGNVSDHNSLASAAMSPKSAQNVIVESEFQRTGSPEFWIGVVAQRSRTNSFRSPKTIPSSNNSIKNRPDDHSHSTKEEDEEGEEEEEEGEENGNDVEPWYYYEDKLDASHHRRQTTDSTNSPTMSRLQAHSPLSPYSPSTLREDHAKNPQEIRVVTYHGTRAVHPEPMATKQGDIKPEPHVPGKLAMSFPTKGHHFSDATALRKQQERKASVNKKNSNKNRKLSASVSSDPFAVPASSATLAVHLSLSQSTGALKKLPSLATASNRSSSPTLGLPKRTVLYHPKFLKQVKDEEEQKMKEQAVAGGISSEMISASASTASAGEEGASKHRNGTMTPLTSLDIIHSIAGDEYRYEVRPSARDILTPNMSGLAASHSSNTFGNTAICIPSVSQEQQLSGERLHVGAVSVVSAESSLSLLRPKPPPVSALPYDPAAHLVPLPMTLNAMTSGAKSGDIEDMMVVSKSILPTRPPSFSISVPKSQQQQGQAFRASAEFSIQMPSLQLSDRPVLDDDVFPLVPVQQPATASAPASAPAVLPDTSTTVASSISTWNTPSAAPGEMNAEEDDDDEEEIDMEAELEDEMRRLFQMGEKEDVAQGPHLSIHDVRFHRKNALFQNSSSASTMVMNERGELVPIDMVQNDPSHSHHLQLMSHNHHNRPHVHVKGPRGSSEKTVMHRVGNLKLPQMRAKKKKRLLTPGALLPPLSISNQPPQHLTHMEVMARPLSRPNSGQLQQPQQQAPVQMSTTAAYPPQFIIRKKSFIDELGNQHVHVVPLTIDPAVAVAHTVSRIGSLQQLHKLSSGNMKVVSVPSASIATNSSGGGDGLVPSRLHSMNPVYDDNASDVSSVLSNISGSVKASQSKNKTVSKKPPVEGLLATVGGNASMWLPRTSHSQEGHFKPGAEQDVIAAGLRQSSMTSQLTMSSLGSLPPK